MHKIASIVVCIVLFSLSSVWADFYRYVDRDGREFFTNDLKQVPPEYRSSATQVKPDAGRVNMSESTPAETGKLRNSSKQHKDKYGRGEEYWKKKAEKLRTKLRDQQSEYDFVQKQLDDQSTPTEGSLKKKKNRTSLEKKKLKLEHSIAQTKRKLDVDLPEEARKADAYPGWIRE